MRGQDPVIDHEVDPGTRHQHCELLQELDWLEEEMGGPVGPRALQGQDHLSLRRERQAILCDRRPEDVTGEPFEGRAIVGRDGDGGVQIEALAASAKTPSTNKLWK